MGHQWVIDDGYGYSPRCYLFTTATDGKHSDVCLRQRIRRPLLIQVQGARLMLAVAPMPLRSPTT